MRPGGGVGFHRTCPWSSKALLFWDIARHFLVASGINVKEYLSPAVSLVMTLKLVLVNENLRKATCMYVVVNTMKVQVLQRQETLHPLHRHQDLGKRHFIEIRAQLYRSRTDILTLFFSNLCITDTSTLSFNTPIDYKRSLKLRLVYAINQKHYHQALIPQTHNLMTTESLKSPHRDADLRAGALPLRNRKTLKG